MTWKLLGIGLLGAVVASVLIIGAKMTPAAPVEKAVPVPTPDHSLLISIDIGHTKQSHGATSARGIGEFFFNQRVA